MATPHLVTDLAGGICAELAGLAEADLTARLRTVADRVSGRVAFSSSLGLEDQVLLHAIAEAKVDLDVFTIDTGRLFPETLALIDESRRRYGLEIRLISPEPGDTEWLVARDGVLGFRHSIEARKACCEVRKVSPLERALHGAAGWVTGLRRGQSAGRAHVPFAAWDDGLKLLKINPIADWSFERLEAFVTLNRVPVNPLHAQGFTSIGCQPCTRAIRPGEDVRAGRWWWEQEDGKECGLHKRPARRTGAHA